MLFTYDQKLQDDDDDNDDDVYFYFVSLVNILPRLYKLTYVHSNN